MPFEIQEVAEALLVICQALKDDFVVVKDALAKLQALLSGDVLRMLEELHFIEGDESADESDDEWLPSGDQSSAMDEDDVKEEED